ncbi:hypothetical protein EPR50_G00108500 [Perca flavescens]|uniref:Uncharacterized protein n=1 Tax=Perca flavescens TaxID=8167 RepID=A0A484CXN0_PERFV|nr:hypothetical protein EPR50_G00108500 [Perca flavescens]
MEPVVILLVMLAGVSHAFFSAADTKCNATQNTSLCSVTLGGSVYIQVMTNASGHKLECKKHLPTGSINVFSMKRDKVKIQEYFKKKTEFFINNGTLKITNVERNDSENILPFWIPVCCALGALLIVVVCCCVCWRVRHHKKSSK